MGMTPLIGFLRNIPAPPAINSVSVCRRARNSTNWRVVIETSAAEETLMATAAFGDFLENSTICSIGRSTPSKCTERRYN